jgi:hypothetical protein
MTGGDQAQSVTGGGAGPVGPAPAAEQPPAGKTEKAAEAQAQPRPAEETTADDAATAARPAGEASGPAPAPASGPGVAPGSGPAPAPGAGPAAAPGADHSAPAVPADPSPDGEPSEAASASPADRSPQPPGTVAPAAEAPAIEAPRAAPAAPAPEPSWGKVLATTISLWTSRRLRRLTGRGGSGGGASAAGTATERRRRARWPLVVFVLWLIIAALTALHLAGVLSPHAKSTTASRPTGGGHTSGASGAGPAVAAAQASRAQAASWIANQVTAADVIACDPLMCSALQADGVAASRLMTIEPTTPDPVGADVVASTASVRSQFGSALTSEYAPQLLASFGTGANRVDVRTVASLGAAAFNTQAQNDLTARKNAGAQLLRQGLLPIGAQGAGQIRSGQVDSRLLVTLAALLSQRSVDVSSFDDTGPGAPVLYRQVTIVDAPGQTGTTALQADLRQAEAQTTPYRPAHAEIVHLANGQSALRIEFGAPDPAGLLSGKS